MTNDLHHDDPMHYHAQTMRDTQPTADVSEDERLTNLMDLEALNYEMGYEDAKGLPVRESKISRREYLRSALTPAKSDERVVSVEDARAALSALSICPFGVKSHRDISDISKVNKTIRALLTHAAGETK